MSSLRIAGGVMHRHEKNKVPLPPSTPCAACKMLRRRCADDCIFAPYFPPEEPYKFASVHKIFGASNVSKMLRDVSVEHRMQVANSLVYEANARLKDPVNGIYGEYLRLSRNYHFLSEQHNRAQSQYQALQSSYKFGYSMQTCGFKQTDELSIFEIKHEGDSN